MKNYKKYFIFCVSFILFQTGFAEDRQNLNNYDGKIIEEIQITTKRIDPAIIKSRFLLKEGQKFSSKLYKEAQENLHDMRIFKKLDFEVNAGPEDNLIIKIEGEDGAYIFPMAFVSGGSQKGAGITFVEGNFFKKGEMVYTFMGFGDDGIMINLGVAHESYFANIKFENLNFDRRYYTNNWVSMGGIFGSNKDKDDFKNPLAEVHYKQDRFSLMFAKTKNNFSVFLKPEYFYVNSNDNLNNGMHSSLTFGASYQKNIRDGINFGALMGYGLSDKKEALSDLMSRKLGFKLSSSLQQGYKWAGSNYKIIKLFAEIQSSLEFKNRNLLLFYLKGQNSFASPFEDKVQTSDLLDFGKYSRKRYGRQGVGVGLSYVWYLVRDNLGLLSLSPFYEFASVYEGKHYYNQSGVGTSLSYKFWRFPFPIGLNYTYGLNDSCHQVSFMIGARF